MGKSELGFQAQVRKVVELTKCSSEDAAYVLSEHNNNVDEAVNAIFDQPDANMWKENKKKANKKKSFKPEIKKKSQFSGNSAQYSHNPATNTRHKNGPMVFESSVLNTKEHVQPTATAAAVNDFPAVGGTTAAAPTGNVMTFNSSVYDSSTIVSLTTTAGDPKKMSFAAVAAKGMKPRAPSPVPPVQQQPSQQHVPPPQPQPNVSSYAEVNTSNVSNDLNLAEEDVKSVSEDVKAMSINEDLHQTNVNREFTDKLKNDIGLSLQPHTRNLPPNSSPGGANLSCGSNIFASSQSPTVSKVQASPILDLISTPDHAHSLSSDAGVEFLDNVQARPTGFEFGYNKYVATSTAAINRLLHESQHQTSPNNNNNHDVTSVRSSAALSYTYPASVVGYQSNDVRQSSGNSIVDSLFVASGGKANGTNNNLTQETLPSQQVLPSISQQQQNLQQQQQALSSQQQPQQSSVHQQPQQQAQQSQMPPVQQQMPQQQQVAANAMQPPLSTQHSLQQQQQQMYTATAQLPFAAFPYLYSPIPNMRDKNTPMIFDSSVLPGQAGHNKAAGSGNDFASVGGTTVTTAGNVPAFNSSVYDGNTNPTTAGDPKKMSYAPAMAPPPGFSAAPHFMAAQQGLQSLFHPGQYNVQVPSYHPPQIPFPVLFPNGPQAQQSQHRQPQMPQNHYGQQQHILPNHHQSQQQRHNATAQTAQTLGMDQISYLDMSKYPNAVVFGSGGSNNNLPGLASAPYHNAAFGIGGNAGNNQGQPLHRNQSLNQDTSEW